MAQLSREEVKQIILDRPTGTSEAEVIGELLNRGHELQGFKKDKKESGVSFGDVASAIGNFGLGAAKAVTEEAINLGNIIAKPFGTKILGLKPEEIGEPQNIGLDLERKGTAQEAGGTTAQVASFLVPGTKAAKIGRVHQAARGGVRGLLGRSAIEGGTAATVSGAQRGAVDRETAFVGGIGAAFPILGGVGTKIGRGAARFFFGPQGLEGIKTRFKDPEGVASFLKTARRQDGGKTLQQFVDKVNDAVNTTKQRTRRAFEQAEKNIVNQSVERSRVTDGSRNLIREFLDEDTLTKETIEQSGVSDQSANVLKKIVRKVDEFDDDTTSGVLKLKRSIQKQFKGTKNTGESDAVVTRLTNHLNDIIAEKDPAFRQAMRDFSEEKKFLDLLRANALGKDKTNLDQTANKLFRIAKDLDDPFRNEGAEEMLRQLERRTGMPIIDPLRALATAENLSPQQSQGLRAGVVRELTRILEVITSETAGVAGRTLDNPQIQSAVTNIRSLTRSALEQQAANATPQRNSL